MIDIIKKPKFKGEIISEGSFEDCRPLIIRFKPKNTFCPDSVKVSLSISQSVDTNDALHNLDFIVKSPATYTAANSGDLGVISFVYEQSAGYFDLEIKPIITLNRVYWEDRRVYIVLEPKQQEILTKIARLESVSLSEYVGQEYQDTLVFNSAFSDIIADNFVVTDSEPPTDLGNTLNLGFIGFTTDFPLVIEDSTAPIVEFEQATLSISEDTLVNPTTLRITRTGNISLQSFIRVSCVGGTAIFGEDLLISPVLDLLFEPEQSEINLNLIPLEDVLVEGTENITVEIFALNNATLGNNSQIVISLLDPV